MMNLILISAVIIPVVIAIAYDLYYVVSIYLDSEDDLQTDETGKDQ